MVLDDLHPPIVTRFALAHVAIVIAQTGEPLDPLGDGIASQAAFVRSGHFLEDEEE